MEWIAHASSTQNKLKGTNSFKIKKGKFYEDNQAKGKKKTQIANGRNNMVIVLDLSDGKRMTIHGYSHPSPTELIIYIKDPTKAHTSKFV